MLYHKISNQLDCSALQRDLYSIIVCWETWQMKINTEKTRTMTFTNRVSMVHNNYTIMNSKLDKVTLYKYLGVYLTTNISWNAHRVHS